MIFDGIDDLLKRMLGISAVGDDQHKPDKPDNFVSNFLKHSRKACFRDGINYPTAWSGASMMIVLWNISKSMDFAKILDFQGFL